MQYVEAPNLAGAPGCRRDAEAGELPSMGSAMPLVPPRRCAANSDLIGDIMGGGRSGNGFRRRRCRGPCTCGCEFWLCVPALLHDRQPCGSEPVSMLCLSLHCPSTWLVRCTAAFCMCAAMLTRRL